MAMSMTELATGPAIACPNPGCARSFACDACMHGHLVRRHNARYVDAFGPTHESLVDFCAEHAACSPSMLGI
ncbi:MAG: hypothetical protein LC624_12000, partial [Halobacteriales archaeon]|nr:hypothetical protein [Halobacteriales archaeon]